MIPYFAWQQFHIGPVPIQVWGTMVALGFILGAYASASMAKSRGLKPELVYDLVGWIVLSAIIGGRLFHVFFYEPEYFLANPAEIIKIWHGGMSVFGGFLGAVGISIWYLRKKRLDVWAYSDVLIFGLPLGLFIGRIGCFLIHDHPGTATDFFLGIKYPDGIVRHDHGLYLSLNGLLLFLVFLIMAKKKVKKGMFLVVFSLWYGAVRFGLDFLRARDGAIVDSRYFGLTPAQYFSIGLFLFGVYLLWHTFTPWRSQSDS